MKKRSGMSRNSFVTVMLSVVIVLSIAFSFTLWANAATHEELDASIDVVNAAKQALDEAQAEAVRLNELKNLFSEPGQEVILQQMYAEVSNVYDIELKLDADYYIALITSIYEDTTLNEFQSSNALAGVLDDWNADVNSKIDDLMLEIGLLCDQYSACLLDFNIDTALAKEALLWEVDDQRYIIIDAILSTDFDPAAVVIPEPEAPENPETPSDVVSGDTVSSDTISGTELPDSAEEPETPNTIDTASTQEEPGVEPPKTATEIMYETIDRARRGTDNAVEDLPNWEKYCIDVVINWSNLYALEQAWFDAKLEAGRLYNEIYGYDYSMTLSSNTYYQQSGKDIKVHINGAHVLVKYFLYFDIYDPIWSDDAGDYVLFSQFLSEGSDYVINEGENGTVDITIKGAALDRLDCGAQNFTVYYAEGEDIEPTEIFIEVMPKVVAEKPEKQEPVADYGQSDTDDGQDNGETPEKPDDNSADEDNSVSGESASVNTDVKKSIDISAAKEEEYQKTTIWETLLKIVPIAIALIGIILMIVRIIRSRKKKKSEK